MTVLKNLLVSGVVIFVAIVGIGFLLPSDFRVERSIVIEAPANEVYEQIVDLRKWQRWGVWFKRDPNMRLTYSGNSKDVGMKSEWVSEEEGSGEMQILSLQPNQSLTYSLYFADFEMGSTGEFNLKEEEGRTHVTWSDYGDVGANPIYHYFALMMDSMIGPDFEAGLENLKILIEQG